MTQPDLNITTALEAIAEGMNILQLLACATDKTQWIDDSVPLSKLNELAQSLGYRDAQSVHSQVEHDRDIEECYVEIRQLRTDLAQAHADHEQGTRVVQEENTRLAQSLMQARTRHAALVTPELPTLLEKVGVLVGGDKGWTSIGHFTSQDGKRCLELAASIREALALEEHK